MSARPALLLRKARLQGARAGACERLAAVLDRVNPAAAGIAGNRVLVLGRMKSPLPLPLDGTIAGRHGMERFVHHFEEALSQRASAARRGKPTGGSDGDWLFEDEAELDSALVLALLHNVGSPNAALLRTITGTPRPDLRLHWRRNILPDVTRAVATIARLAETGAAATWLAGFDRGELRAVTTRIVQFHGGIPHLNVASVRSGAQDDAPEERAPSNWGASSARAHAISELAASLAPIATQARADAPEPETARLVLVALVAQRRPALIGLGTFVEAVEQVLESASPPAPRSSTHSERARPRPETAAMAPAAGPTLPLVPHDPRPAVPEPDAPNATGSAIAARGTTLPVSARGAIRQTDFGGLPFLLNAFIALGLWGDFTRPGDGLPGLSPFELLVLLGKHWFGRAFIADPLHDVLRDLAGLQRDEVAGRHFQAPPWSVLDSWLLPWPQAKARSRHGAMWHPAGFALNDPDASSRSALRQRRHWTVALARYLRARSAMALGVGADEALVLLCCCKATLDIGGESMTVHLSLQDHPLEVRMAGLDRDPGRLAGCVHAVAFEFGA